MYTICSDLQLGNGLNKNKDPAAPLHTCILGGSIPVGPDSTLYLPGNWRTNYLSQRVSAASSLTAKDPDLTGSLSVRILIL